MKKKIVALVMASAMALAMAACGSTATSEAAASAASEAEEAVEETASAAEEAASAAEEAASEAASEAAEEVEATVEVEEAAEEEAGFTEIPIWEDEEVGPEGGEAWMNVSGVYFQPVPMSGGNENYEDYDLHFEADVSAMENELGYGVGDWIPYMTATYEITGSDGSVAAEGTFMPMAASDGPHYGANISLPNADTYSVKLNFDIDENSYLIHLDEVTGPGGTLDQYFPIEVTLENVWDYVPQEW